MGFEERRYSELDVLRSGKLSILLPYLLRFGQVLIVFYRAQLWLIFQGIRLATA